MKNQRPVNLDLTTIKFPLTAIVSILHRISGIIIFLSIPLLLFFLQSSLASATEFLAAKNFWNHSWLKFICWLLLSSFAYHLVCGLRHLFLDVGIGDSKEVANLTAKITLIVTIIFSLAIGVWLW